MKLVIFDKDGSNQGGCAKQSIHASALKVGQHVWSTKNTYLGIVTEIKSGIFYCADAGYSTRHDTDVLVLKYDGHGVDQVLYVGDRPEDEAAAKAANIPFQWAHEWLAKGV